MQSILWKWHSSVKSSVGSASWMSKIRPLCLLLDMALSWFWFVCADLHDLLDRRHDRSRSSIYKWSLDRYNAAPAMQLMSSSNDCLIQSCIGVESMTCLHCRDWLHCRITGLILWYCML